MDESHEINLKEWDIKKRDYNLTNLINFREWEYILDAQYNKIQFNAVGRELGLTMAKFLTDINNISYVLYMTKVIDSELEKENYVMIYKTKNDWYVEFNCQRMNDKSSLRLSYSKSIDIFLGLISI